MRLIGLAGFKGVGKSTVAAVLERENWERLCFAGPIKAMLTAGFGIDFARLTSEQKATPLDWLDVDPRRLMQTLGDEWGRSLIDPAIWLKLMQRRLDRDRGMDTPSNWFVVDDVRYDNEAALIKSNGGIMVEVTRSSFDRAQDDHRSEKGVSKSFIDHRLNLGHLDPDSAAYRGYIKSVVSGWVR